MALEENHSRAPPAAFVWEALVELPSPRHLDGEPVEVVMVDAADTSGRFRGMAQDATTSQPTSSSVPSCQAIDSTGRIDAIQWARIADAFTQVHEAQEARIL